MQKQSKTHSHKQVKTRESSRQNFRQSLEQLYEKDVICLSPDDTVFAAAQEMLENHIGNIVVSEERDGKNIPLGIVTDRDIVINAMAKKLDPETVKLSEIMNSGLVTASEDDDLMALVKLVVDEGVSRVPIVDSTGALIGILTSKRLFQFFAQGLCELTSISLQQQRREERTH